MFRNKKNPANGRVDAEAEKNDKITDSQNNVSTGGKISTTALKRLLCASNDIVFNDFYVNGLKKFGITTVFVEGMVDSKTIDDDVLKPLMQQSILGKSRDERELIDHIVAGNIYHNRRVLRDKLDDCVSDILAGSIALIFDKSGLAVTFETIGFEKRNIVEPTNENVIKGAKESFIEVLRVNTALVRRRIQSSTLLIQEMKIGKRTSTGVSILYLSDIANQNVVKQVKQRLKSIQVDGIASAGQIEALIIDNKITFMPQLLYTERVDKLCASILEGRVGILVDGLPLAFIVPVDINAFLQAPEDYAINYIVSSLLRLMRYLCAFLALVLPSLYVSVTTFHHEMIPTKLAISIIRSKQGVPLPTYLEVILMLVAFEILLEAGLRLPKSVGQAVSIVGALVVGEAAISASILSPAIVITISTAGIAGFVIPSQDLSNVIRLCRLLFVLLAITSGLFGVTIGLIALFYHMCSIEIFGVPYMSPVAANQGKDMFNDTIFRIPWLKLNKRPSNIGAKDTTRISE